MEKDSSSEYNKKEKREEPDDGDPHPYGRSSEKEHYYDKIISALQQVHFVPHFVLPRRVHPERASVCLRLSVEGSDLGVEDRPKDKVKPQNCKHKPRNFLKG